jgi:hypothetical protein
MMVDPITLVTAADMARVADVPLSSVTLWLKITERPAVGHRNGEALYVSSVTQALLDAVAADAGVPA